MCCLLLLFDRSVVASIGVTYLPAAVSKCVYVICVLRGFFWRARAVQMHLCQSNAITRSHRGHTLCVGRWCRPSYWLASAVWTGGLVAHGVTTGPVGCMTKGLEGLVLQNSSMCAQPYSSM